MLAVYRMELMYERVKNECNTTSENHCLLACDDLQSDKHTTHLWGTWGLYLDGRRYIVTCKQYSQKGGKNLPNCMVSHSITA